MVLRTSFDSFICLPANLLLSSETKVISVLIFTYVFKSMQEHTRSWLNELSVKNWAIKIVTLLHTHTHTLSNSHTHTHTHIHTQTSICLYIYLSFYLFIYLSICLCVCLCVFVRACTCVCECILLRSVEEYCQYSERNIFFSLSWEWGISKLSQCLPV